MSHSTLSVIPRRIIAARIFVSRVIALQVYLSTSVRSPPLFSTISDDNEFVPARKIAVTKTEIK